MLFSSSSSSSAAAAEASVAVAAVQAMVNYLYNSNVHVVCCMQ
jgi:hypothetical protein